MNGKDLQFGIQKCSGKYFLHCEGCIYGKESIDYIRKETVKEILQTIWEELGIDILSQCYTIPIKTFNKLKRQFGVEVNNE